MPVRHPRRPTVGRAGHAAGVVDHGGGVAAALMITRRGPVPAPVGGTGAHAPSPARPLWPAAFANPNRKSGRRVDFGKIDRPPLLITGAGADHTVRRR